MSDRASRTLWTELAARAFLAQRRGQEALAVIENAPTPQGPSLRFLRGEVLESRANEDALWWYEVAREDYSGELYVAAIARARARLGAARR